MDDNSIHLLELNYKSLHEAVWNNHKVSWEVTSIFIGVIFVVQGYMIKENFDFWQTIIGVFAMQILIIIWLLIMRIFDHYNHVRFKRLKDIEEIFENEISQGFGFKQYSIPSYREKWIEGKFRPMAIYLILFWAYTSTNTFLVGVKMSHPIGPFIGFIILLVGLIHIAFNKIKKEKRRKYETKEIAITNSCKEQLVGNLHTADTKDLVIVCHGLGWHKDNELIIAICKSFQEKGVNSFRFNFSGIKPSEGKPEDSYYTKQASDLCSVVDFFSIQGYQIKSIIGHSMGASATIIQAAKDRRIVSIILIAPRIKPSNSIIVKAIIESGKTLSEAIDSTDSFYFVEIKGKKGKGRKTYSFSKKYLEDLKDIDIVGYLKQVKIPTLILRGTNDNIVSMEEVEEACKANKVVRHIQISGAGHTFKKSEEKNKVISKILQWYESI